MSTDRTKSVWLTLLSCGLILLGSFALSTAACGPGTTQEKADEKPVGGDAGGGKDQGTPDTGKEEQSNPDTSKPDAGNPDTGKPDQGTPDQGNPDQGKPPTGNGNVQKIEAASTKAISPFDATPGPDAKMIYYTAMKKVVENEITRMVGTLYSVAASGGTPKELATNFQSPIGVVSSTDGKTIYVADTGTGATAVKQGNRTIFEESDKNGVIYQVDATGGTPQAIDATKGYKPRSMDIRKENGVDVLYFSGTDPSDGQSGVFQVKTDSLGTVKAMYKGVALADPSGVAVAKNGDIFVADASTGEGAAERARLVLIKAGKASELLSGIRVGYPAGIALTASESFVMISGLKRIDRDAVVFKYEIATKKVTTISKGLEGNTESGGVHRAHNKDTYAWSNCGGIDDDGNGTGTVYLLSTQP